MSTHNITFSIYKSKTAIIIPNQQLLDFFQGTQRRVRTAVVNEPSVFEPLKFYCNLALWV